MFRVSSKKRCRVTACPLWKSGREVPFSGSTSKGGVAIIGESPGFEEEQASPPRPFIGKAGKLGRKIGQEVGLPWEECFILNSARCRIDKKALSLQEITLVLKCCRQHVITALTALEPKLIIILGDFALRQVLKHSGVTKARGRGLVFSKEFNTWTIASFHPAHVLRNPGQEGFLREDLKRAVQFLQNGPAPKEAAIVCREIVDPWEILKEGGSISFDTESQGLDWMDPNFLLLSYSFSPTPDQAYNVTLYREVPTEEEAEFSILWPRWGEVVKKTKSKNGEEKEVRRKEKVPTQVWLVRTEEFDRKVDGLLWVLRNPKIKKSMHHGQFDLHALDAFFSRVGESLEINGWVLDTQAGAHVLDENLFTLAPLERLQQFMTLLSVDYKGTFENQYDKGDMLAVPEEARTDYACLDSAVTKMAAVYIKKGLSEEKKLLNYYVKMVQPTLRYALYEMEKNGAWIDLERLPDTLKEVGEAMDIEASEALKVVPKRILEAHEKKGTKLTRDDFLRDIFFSKEGFGLEVGKLTESKLPSTDKETRTTLMEGNLSKKVRTFIEHYDQWSELNTLFTRYLRGFEKHVKEDRRIHSSFSLCAADTGRSSSRNVNMQNNPKRSKSAGLIRRLIAAPPGWLLIAADQVQSEIRWTAHVSRCKGLIAAFRRGEDIHINTARTMMDWDKVSEEEQKKARQKAKPVSFGIIFMISPSGLVTYAKKDYGVVMSEKEAEAYIEKWFALYPEVKSYQRKTIEFGRKYGYVESPLGRRRRLPGLNSDQAWIRGDAERKAVNFPIQGPSSDAVLLSANELIRTGQLPPDEIKTILFVHDELIWQVREDLVDKYVPIIKNALENPPLKRDFGFSLLVPLEAEVSVGRNLAEMEELRL